MKILHAVLNLSRVSAGVGQVVLALAEEQIKAGHDVRLICLNDAYLENDMKGKNFNIYKLSLLGPHQFGFTLGFEAALKAWKPDLIHSHGVWDYFLWASSRLSRKFRIPHFVSTHGTLTEWALKWHSGRKFFLKVLFQSRCFNRAACLFVHRSEEAAVKERKLAYRVVNHGVNIMQCLPSPASVKSSPEISLPDKRKILFLGRLHPKKGLLLFLEAAADFLKEQDGWVVVVAGSDEGNHQHFLKKKVKELELSEKVLFVGPVYGENKIKLISESDFFILTSYSEGFSMAIAEALALGIPVLISEECFFSEVQSLGFGAVCRLEKQDIQAKLYEMISKSAQDLRSMGRAAAEWTAYNLNWQQINKIYIEEYQKATSCI